MYDVTKKYAGEYLRGMAERDLVKLLRDAEKVKLEFAIDRASRGGLLVRPRLLWKVRKDITRMKTALREIGGRS